LRRLPSVEAGDGCEQRAARFDPAAGTLGMRNQFGRGPRRLGETIVRLTGCGRCAFLLLAVLTAACSDPAGFLSAFPCDCFQPDGAVLHDGYFVSGSTCVTRDEAAQNCPQVPDDAGGAACEVIRKSCACSTRE